MRRSYDFEWFKVKWIPRYGWVMSRKPAVMVVAVAPDGKIWLERVTRIPTGTTSWEVPGGQADDEEDAVGAGLRELEEECALIAKGGGRLLPVPLEMAPGMGSFIHYVVVASDVVPKGRRPVAQAAEGITAVRKFDRARVHGLLKRGQITVHSTLAALALAGWLDGARVG